MGDMSQFRNPVMNAFRSLATVFPGFFGDRVGRTHKVDFKWPDYVSPQMCKDMYERNGLAEAAVEKTSLKTWETSPVLREDDNPQETDRERTLRKHLERIRFWSTMVVADRRALVWGWSFVIMRFADGRAWDQPVASNVGGPENLVEMIPAWASEMLVEKWDMDPRSPTYGHPLMYQYNEINNDVDQVTGKPRVRSVKIHPSRVIVWSPDGLPAGKSLLEAGYNALLDAEKISGAGGEGFWKIAKAAPHIEIDKEATPAMLAKAMGVPVDQIHEAMSDTIKGYQKGFDEFLMLQGMKATNPQIQLPNPQHFFGTSLMIFAASVNMPARVLIGSQTGERSSQEDGKEWINYNMSRRVNFVRPILLNIIDRLSEIGVLPRVEWELFWEPLTSDGPAERASQVTVMSTANFQALQYSDERPFSNNEIRKALGHPPQEGGSGNDYEIERKERPQPGVEEDDPPNPAADPEDDNDD